jgi:hypothetical protein
MNITTVLMEMLKKKLTMGNSRGVGLGNMSFVTFEARPSKSEFHVLGVFTSPTYCDMMPESRNSEVRIDVHC